MLSAGLSFFGKKHATQLGLDAEQREKAGGDHSRIYPFRRAADVDVEAVAGYGGQMRKALVLLEVDKFRRRNPILIVGDADVGESHPELHQLLGLLVRQWLENHRVDDAEDG